MCRMVVCEVSVTMLPVFRHRDSRVRKTVNADLARVAILACICHAVE